MIDGNFNGTILAPYADVKSEDGCNGHLSGSLIAKSFEGGLEFGYRPYRGTVDILGSSNGYAVPFDKFITDTDHERLSGATFGIYEVNDDGTETQVSSFTIGNDTEYVNIPSKVEFDEGSENERTSTTIYKIREDSAPQGFIKDTVTEYTVTIVEEVVDGIFNEPIEGGSGILTGIPSEVKATVKIEGNNDYETQTFSINLKDIWAYNERLGREEIVRRELVVDDETFTLTLITEKLLL